MIVSRGMGDASDYLNSIGGNTSDNAPGSYLASIASTAPASSGDPVANFLSELGVTPSASVQPQTFSQWVTANSTLLLVAFGAVGALVALTRAGR